jgi:hypothetical protein
MASRFLSNASETEAELLKAYPQLEKVSVSNPASPRVHQHDLAQTPGYQLICILLAVKKQIKTN